MTTPLWALLAFAGWTLLTLALTVGTHRWGRILTGRSRFEDYAEYRIEGTGFYARGMRAHANCVENLPIFAAIVAVASVTGIRGPTLDVLSLVVIGARIPHTFVHVAFEQTNHVVVFRSMFFNLQWLAMLAMVVAIALRAAIAG